MSPCVRSVVAENDGADLVCQFVKLTPSISGVCREEAEFSFVFEDEEEHTDGANPY